jgi:hypothetical protein
MRISDMQTQILAVAAAHPLRLAMPPARPPVAADEHDAWTTEAGPVT